MRWVMHTGVGGRVGQLIVVLLAVLFTLPATAKKKPPKQKTFEQLIKEKKLYSWSDSSELYENLWGECDDLLDKEGEPISRRACKKYRKGMSRLIYKRRHFVRSASATVLEFNYNSLTQSFRVDLVLEGEMEENEPVLVTTPLNKGKMKKVMHLRMCSRKFANVGEAAAWRKSVKGKIVAQIFAVGAKGINMRVGRGRIRGTLLNVKGVRFMDSKTGAIACSNPGSTAINIKEPLGMYGYMGKTAASIYKPSGKKRGFLKLHSLWRNLQIILDRTMVLPTFAEKKSTDLLLSVEAGKTHKLVLFLIMKNKDHLGLLEMEFKVDEGENVTVNAPKLQYAHHGGKIVFTPETLNEAYESSAKFGRAIQQLIKADTAMRKLKVDRARKILNDLLKEFPKPGNPVYNAAQTRLKKLGKP